MHVLSHEAMHMTGYTDEAEAECRAMQVDARTARLLGAPEDAARALRSADVPADLVRSGARPR